MRASRRACRRALLVPEPLAFLAPPPALRSGAVGFMIENHGVLAAQRFRVGAARGADGTRIVSHPEDLALVTRWPRDRARAAPPRAERPARGRPFGSNCIMVELRTSLVQLPAVPVGC